MSSMVVIDGSFGEGGGQILRTSLTLAAVTGRPVRIFKIRAGRPNPGLAAQHLTAVRAAAAVCGGRVRGDRIGSTEVIFEPGQPQAGEYEFDVAAERGSAGAASLVLQTVLPILLAAGGDSQVTIHGGTAVPWSPSYEYLAHVFVPALRRMDVWLEVSRPRAGFYPHGGGTIVARVRGSMPSGLNLTERGKLRRIVIHSVVSQRLPAHIGPRQIAGCRQALGQWARRAEVEEIDDHVPAGGPGTAVAAAAQFESGFCGAIALGKRGKPAEKVGAEAGLELARVIESGAAVDAHLADQLLLYAAMAAGPSQFTCPEITGHLETNAHVIGNFVDVKVAWEEVDGGLWRVEVRPRQ